MSDNGNQVVIEFSDLRKSFGSLTVLDGVNLKVEEGKVTTIIGKSGVGKSVLLKHVVGLLRPDAGQVLFRGKPIAKMKREEVKALRRSISYMFQNMALFDSMTIFENIALPLDENTGMSKEEIADRVHELMESLELEGIGEKYPAQLSGGMRKRVALARALAIKPKIILFDEPTTGLDPVRKQAVHRMIAHNQQQYGYTALVVSHDIPDVFDISQKVAFLFQGRILVEGTPDDVINTDDEEVRAFIEGEEDLSHHWPKPA